LLRFFFSNHFCQSLDTIMARQLLIMRHAKSDWGSAATADFERPLNKRGCAAAPKMGRWLKQQRLLPDHVVSSPATRARQTVTLVCRELEYDDTKIVWDQRIYEANVQILTQVLAQCPATAQRVLLVGHNPGLENLILSLSGETAAGIDDKYLPTATVAQLQMPDDWQGLTVGCGRLLSLTRPRSLAE
jgi:phosphohistidine phosphatase